MKNIYTLLVAVIISVGILLPSIAIAQSPEKMTYQSIIRNSSDILLTNQSLGMQISILHGSASGTAVYVEIQNPTSNINGLVSLEIGTGTVLSGNFTTIDWANGPYYIKTEIDPNGGASYTIAGTSQMLSVPYALYGEDADADPTNELDNTDNQTLSISGSNLSIVGGNTVTLPSAGSTCWTASGTNICNNNTGSVGIGIASPTFLLDVQSSTNAYLNIEATSTGSSFGGIVLNRPNTSSKMRLFFQTASVNKWGVGLFNTSENFSITRNTSIDDGTFNIDYTDGFIGIGTTSPLAMLHVAKTSTETEAVFGEDFGYPLATDVSIGNSTGDSYLYLGQASSYKGYIAWDYDATATNAVFKIGTFGGYNDMVLQNVGGNVGVGANPDCKFHVTGAEMRLSHSTTCEMSFYRSTTEIANINVNTGNNLLIQTVNSGGIYLNSEGLINFNTLGGLAMSLASDRKVGIGTSSPTNDLTIKQSSYSALSAGLCFDYYTGTYDPWTIYRTSLFLRFAYDDISVAYVNGTTGAWVASSDRRLKENITGMESVLDRVNKLEAVRYNFIDRDNSNTIGFIAQDVLPLFPEVVSGLEEVEEDESYYGIAYGQMSIIAIKAIQEQQEIIKDLQKQIDELREIIIND